jgi:hypothetical protein
VLGCNRNTCGEAIVHALYASRNSLADPSERLFGGVGQAIVQMSRDRLNGLEYAIKLFLSRRTFNVRLLYIHLHHQEASHGCTSTASGTHAVWLVVSALSTVEVWCSSHIPLHTYVSCCRSRRHCTQMQHILLGSSFLRYRCTLRLMNHTHNAFCGFHECELDGVFEFPDLSCEWHVAVGPSA